MGQPSMVFSKMVFFDLLHRFEIPVKLTVLKNHPAINFLGRIEGYLEGCRSLSPRCMKSPTIAPLIAKALVRLHTFEIEEVRQLNEPGESGLWKKLFLFVNCAKGFI